MPSFSIENKLRQAKKFHKSGDINSAREICLEIIEKFPKNQKALKFLKHLSKSDSGIIKKPLQEAIDPTDYLIQLYTEKKYTQLIDETLQCLSKSPSSHTLWNLLGAANIALNKTQEAYLAFKRVTELDPLYAEGFNNLGITLDKLGSYAEAIIAFEKAIELSPDNAELFNNLGKALVGDGRVDEAVNAYKISISLHPRKPYILMRLGAALAMQSKFDEACEIFDAAIKIQPKNAKLHFNLGSVLQDHGLYERAISAYKTAISIKPDHADTWYNLGLTCRSHGNLEEAIKSFERTIELAPDYLEAKHLLSAVLGQTTQTAPRQYVENLFDANAGVFEKALVEKLEYRVPQILAALMTDVETYDRNGPVLDLGCGTGLVGHELNPCFSSIDGVDLSQSMLNVAQTKSIYNKLIHEDIVQFLGISELDYQYFVAADVFIYIGELSEVFRLIKSRNKRSGNVIFSTEHSEIDGYHLEKSGRYSHSKSYIENLCAEYGYEIHHFSETNLRKQNNTYLKAGIYSLRF